MNPLDKLKSRSAAQNLELPETIEIPEFHIDDAPLPHAKQRQKTKAKDRIQRIDHKKEEQIPKEEIEIRLEEELNEAEEKRERRESFRRVLFKCIQIFFIVGCAYLILLIYGVFNTEYIYDANGNVVPEILTVGEIKKANEFEAVAASYREARDLYEQILDLDYSYYSASLSPDASVEYMVLAPKYEELREKTEKIHTNIESVEVSSTYTLVHGRNKTFIENIDTYCHLMNFGLTGDAEKMQSATALRDILYADFMSITEQLYNLGVQVNGTDISDMKEWSPESYIQNKYGIRF